jgi:hypothetical protein
MWKPCHLLLSPSSSLKCHIHLAMAFLLPNQKQLLFYSIYFYLTFLFFSSCNIWSMLFIQLPLAEWNFMRIGTSHVVFTQ